MVPLVSKADTPPPNGPLVTQLSGPGGTLTKKLVNEVAVWPPTTTVIAPLVAPTGTVVVILVVVLAVTVAAIPLKLTTLLTGVAEKFAPVMVTVVPIIPLVGAMPVMAGEVTVKLEELGIGTIPTVIGPVVAPAGTVVVMLVTELEVTVASTPLNFTLLFVGISEKLVPAIVTAPFAAPLVGVKLVIVGSVLTNTPLPCVPANTLPPLEAIEEILVFVNPGMAVQLVPLLEDKNTPPSVVAKIFVPITVRE